MGNLGGDQPRRLHGHPRAGASTPTRRCARWREERCTSLYGVPTMFIAMLGSDRRSATVDLDSLRTGIMAGSPCPVEVMKRVIDEMHMSEVSICYGMTETSPVSTQTRRDDSLERRVGVGRARRPARRGQGRRPGLGARAAARRAGRAVHPRLLGDARILARGGEDGRGDRRGRLDAHRRPGDDGRRRLLQHRRAHQGPRDPRRRERLPARGRGVPLRPPADRRRAGDRRPRRALRRGAVRVGAAAPRRRARRRGGPRVLHAAASPTTRCRATCSSSTSSR